MSSEKIEAADRRWAALHARRVDNLVLEYALTASSNREFGEPLERIPAWREARAKVLGLVEGTVAEHGAAGDLNDSALLRELVTGMRAAAESNPEVARVLGDPMPPGDYRDPSVINRSAWTAANWAVRDERQWRQPEPGAEASGHVAEHEAER
jgi:hypothetical protein